MKSLFIVVVVIALAAIQCSLLIEAQEYAEYARGAGMRRRNQNNNNNKYVFGESYNSRLTTLEVVY